MELKNTILPSSILIVLSLYFMHSITTVESATSCDVDAYIKKCCNATLYTDLCYSSLSSNYTGQADLGSLTCFAIKVSLTEATKLANYVASMNRTTVPGSQAAKALKDCTKLTKSSVGQVKQSLKKMVSVVKAARSGAYNESYARRMKFEMSTVQTWMSAGITYQDTCLDGFKDLGVKDGDDKKVENDVSGKVWEGKMFISNALALVNSFASAFH